MSKEYKVSETPREIFSRLQGGSLGIARNDTISRLRGKGLEIGKLAGLASGVEAELSDDGVDSEKFVLPEDYNIPHEVVEKIIERRNLHRTQLKTVHDPSGIVTPGLVLTSAHDAARRRLVTDIFKGHGDGPSTTVHIEGESAIHNMSLADLQERITDGRLQPWVPAAPTIEK